MSEIRFDPQTGEPINRPVEPVQEPVQSAEPVQPTVQAPAPKKGKAGKIVAGLVAAAVLIGGGVFAVKNLGGGGLGGGTPYEQIKAASEATFAPDELTGMYKEAVEFMQDGTYSVDAQLKVSGQDATVNFDTDKGKLCINIEAAGIKGLVYMDEEKVTLQANQLGIDPLSYNYTSDKSDAADSYIGSSFGVDTLKQIDSVLKMAYSAANTDKSSREEMEKQIDEKCETLEFEEIEAESIKVGGQDVKCGGYSTSVSGEFVAEMVDDVAEKTYGKSLSDLIAQIPNLDSVDDPMQKIRELENIDLKFYLNDGKLAQVGVKTKLDDQDVDVTASFAGEDIPWYDTVLVNNQTGEEVTLKAHKDGSVTTYELTDGDGETGSISYDKDSGELTALSGDQTVLKGELKSNSEEVSFVLKETSGSPAEVSLKLNDVAAVAEAPEGKDVLTMSQEDFARIGTAISSLLYGL